VCDPQDHAKAMEKETDRAKDLVVEVGTLKADLEAQKQR
jgi:hypothetical protein